MLIENKHHDQNIININPEFSNEISSIINKYLTLNPYKDLEKFLRKAALASFALPDEIKDHLLDFKKYGNEEGFLLFKDLPIDPDLMDTPKEIENVVKQKKTFYSEFWLSAFGGFFGDPFSYIQESKGVLFHDLRPDPKKQKELSAESSSVMLDFHTETAFHPHLPDFLLLFCLRGDRDKKAKTIVSSLRHFAQDIDPRLENILRQPLFKTGIDYAFGSVSGTRGNGPVMPIIYGDSHDPLIIFDPELMLGLTEEANQAITALKKIIDKHQKGVVLEPGNLLIVDNLRALHGRTIFKAYFDGQDRWLQRLYVSRNLTRANMQFSKSERVISHQFL